MMRSLRGRLLVSYLLLILVGVSTVALGAGFVINVFFQEDVRVSLSGKGISEADMDAVNAAFSSGVLKALSLAALASLATAIAASFLISARLARPLQAIINATRRIASGNYAERVQAPGVREIDELAYSFNQMAMALEQNEKLRRDMVADVAHELRTPLTAIEGHMEGLLDGVIEPSPEVFGLVEREARRLHRLANELSELARIESPNLALKLEPLEPLEIVQEVAGRVRPQFDFKEIRLEIAPDRLGGARVLANRDRLEQVLINLLSNALRYTDRGSVTIELEASDRSLEFRVKDTGIGIAAEDLPRVFERFYRVDKSRSRSEARGGSGIGLTIVQRLVEAMNGDVWIESEPGRGTCVHFNLPRAWK